MGKVTFVVEYENGKEPTVHKGLPLLGGSVISFSWRDVIESNNFLKTELEKLANFNPDWDMLEESQASWRELNSYYKIALTRIAQLEVIEAAHKAWSDKTDWIQESEPSRFNFESWGMHRADVMSQHIYHLESVIDKGNHNKMMQLAHKLSVVEKEKEILVNGIKELGERIDSLSINGSTTPGQIYTLKLVSNRVNAMVAGGDSGD